MHGCQRCGSPKLKQQRHYSTFGVLCVLLGLCFTPMTLGISLVLGLIVFFVFNKTMAKCRACGWQWKVG